MEKQLQGVLLENEISDFLCVMFEDHSRYSKTEVPFHSKNSCVFAMKTFVYMPYHSCRQKVVDCVVNMIL